MPITTLDQAIATHLFRPEEIKVSHELFKELEAAGRIKLKLTYRAEQHHKDSWMLDNDIFIYNTFELNDFQFELPAKP